MGTGFDMLAALCAPATSLPSGGGILAALLLAGLAGSAMHCAPMCGGFVLGQVTDRVARLPAARLCEWQRIGVGALLPYHAGRLTTYAVLGTLAGGTGSLLARLPWFGLLSAALLLLAAVLFLLHGLRRLLPPLAALERAPRRWGRAVARLTARIDRSRATGGYALGLVLGLLPCGFLYAALAAAGATLNPLLGGLGMLAFGLGTAPALIAVGIAGHAAGHRWRSSVARLSPAVMLLNAALLAALAARHLMLAT